MTITDLHNTITDIFTADVLDRFPEEWAITHHGRESLRRIGYATNLTPETVTRAAELGVDLLLTHHDCWPFLFEMRDACFRLLAEAGMSHCFVHLPLDAADFGTSATLAARIGGRVVAKSHVENTLPLGRVVAFDDPRPFAALVEQVAGMLDEPVRAWAHHDRPIGRLGIVTGGGLSTQDVREAVAHGCDAYLTGEKVLYTVEYARYAGINLIIGSHTHTELPGTEALAQEIARRFAGTTAVCVDEGHFE